MMRRGHSLNELMIAVSLSMVLMSLIFAIAVNLQGGSEKINRRVDQNSAAQATIDLIRADVELAGHRWGGGDVARRDNFPGGCAVDAQGLSGGPSVGLVPGPQQVVLRSDRFPNEVQGFQVGQRDQVPDGRLTGLDEEVIYAFERYDETRNLWRLKRAYRTGLDANNGWQCMTLMENLVIPDDGEPFRYDVLVTRAGRRTVDRHLNLANPVGRRARKPFGGRVPNDLFDIDGRGGVDVFDFDALTTGSLIAGVQMRFCMGDGRDLPGGGAYSCNPENMRRSSNNLRLVEVGMTTKNLLTWRAYIEGRQG